MLSCRPAVSASDRGESDAFSFGAQINIHLVLFASVDLLHFDLQT